LEWNILSGMCDELKTVLETDLHTEMWIQVKLTLCFKLFAELEKQIKEIEERYARKTS